MRQLEVNAEKIDDSSASQPNWDYLRLCFSWLELMAKLGGEHTQQTCERPEEYHSITAPSYTRVCELRLRMWHIALSIVMLVWIENISLRCISDVI